jgi:Big-like domain-containing protein
MLQNKAVRAAVLVLVVLTATAMAAQADPHPGQSQNVGIISDTLVINGGSFPTTTSGPTGSFTDFTFTNVPVASVSAATLSAFDTVLLNAASTQMGCDVNNLSVSQKTDLVNFLNGGGKLIIYDSECPPQDYSWLPNPFTTSNPGALGGTGTVNVVEDNFLGTDISGDPHFIDEVILGQQTDAVGDMNVLITQDPDICLHMSGTNAAQESGPTHVYYPSGSGLLVYNGFDVDFMSTSSVPDSSTPDGNIAKLWLQELQQPLDGTGLACRVAVVGIALAPQQATNPVGTPHTVTATVTDQAGNPRANVLVTFQVTGANAGAGGTCNPPSCQTDANGQVTFTYTGTTAGQDSITACFTPQGGGNPVCSSPATKTWTQAQPPPGAGCKVTGGGQITAANGDKANFGGNAHPGTPPKGQEQYTDHGPATPIKFHSINVERISCSTDRTQATIEGKGTINGQGSFDYQIDVKDLGEPGGNDTYRIRLSNGYDSGEQTLDGGNIQIHQK